MSARDSYLDHLAQVPLLAACSRRELQKIARVSDELQVDAGVVLVEQGATGRECYIVIDGTAAVRRGTRKVATVGPGGTIGELSLLDHGPRTATVVAETPMTLLVLGSRQFAGVLEDVPSMARKLLAALATRVRDLDSKAFG